MKTLPAFIIWLLCPGFCSQIFAQEPEETMAVTFRVDMEVIIDLEGPEFDPQQHQVYVSGSFCDWQPPGTDPQYELQPVEPGSLIYAVTLWLAPGNHTYKYFLVEDQPTWELGEWADEPHRQLEVSQLMEVNDVWGSYSEILTFLLPLPNQVYDAGKDQQVQAQVGLRKYAEGDYHIAVRSENYYEHIDHKLIPSDGTHYHYFNLSPLLARGKYQFLLWYYLPETNTWGELVSHSFLVENDSVFLEIQKPDSASYWIFGINEPSLIVFSTNITRVDILYSLNNGQSWELVAENVSTSYPSDSYEWHIPLEGDEYYPQARILIRDHHDHEIFDVSAPFSLSSRPVAILSPQPGQTFEVGKDDHIPIVIQKKFDDQVHYMMIFIDVDTGAQYGVPDPAVASVPGEYRHEYPLESNHPSGDFLLNLYFYLPDYDFDGATYGVISGLKVAITNPGPWIEVLFPEPGDVDVFFFNQTAWTNWKSGGIDRVNILYSTDNGTSWELVADSVASSGEAIHQFAWKMPAQQGVYPESFIRVERTDDPQVFDLSPPFTIAGPYEILKPDSNTVLVAGDSLEVTVNLYREADAQVWIRNPDSTTTHLGLFDATAGITTHYFTDTGGITPGDKILVVSALERPIASDTFLVVAPATTYEVTFNLDMSDVEDFDPEVHHVYVTGSFSNWAEPGTEGAPELQRADGQHLIYTVTTQVAPGTCSYKYYSDVFGPGWQGAEWPGDTTRIVEVASATPTDDLWGAHEDIFFDLVLQAAPPEGGTLSGAGSYNAGQQPELTAAPHEGFSFISWNNASGDTLGHDPDFIYRMPAANVSLTAVFEPATGTDQGDEITTTHLFPNPASTGITVAYGVLIHRIVITDVNGRILMEQLIEGFEARISVEGLKPGFYFVKWYTLEGTETRKMIIQ